MGAALRAESLADAQSGPRSAKFAISAEGVELTIAGKRILGGVSLSIEHGSFTCLIGHSGAGKTTLLRLLGGFVRPTAGVVQCNGVDLKRPNKKLAFVFQDYGRALLPWRTVRGNVELALEARHVPRQSRAAIVDTLLDQVGLSEAAASYPRQLSGGMQQRTQIARALAQTPDVLLMDEPFGALDAMTRQALQDELLRLCRDRSITVLFVTHDLEEAIYLGDRIIALDANPGRVAEEIIIDLPRDRKQLETREDPLFLAYRHRLYQFLTRDEPRGKR